MSDQENKDFVTDVGVMLSQLWDLHPPHYHRVPCNHPCSLMRSDVSKLRDREYWVSPKTDGVRMFLLLSFTDTEDYAVLVDRAFGLRRVKLKAPMDAYSGTLLDGELVTSGHGMETYVVFDAIAVNGYSMIRKVQSERMAAAVTLLSMCDVSEDPALRLKAKRWFQCTPNLSFDDVRRSADGTPTDGFIFVPEQGHILRPGQQRDHFKWKPVTHHTIDMVWKDGCLWLESRGTPVRADEVLSIMWDGGPVLRGMKQGDVVECSVSRSRSSSSATSWIATFARLRSDKLHPNDVKVARLTLQNIEENIQLFELQ